MIKGSRIIADTGGISNYDRLIINDWREPRIGMMRWRSASWINRREIVYCQIILRLNTSFICRYVMPVRLQAFISDGLIFVKCLRITKSSINELPRHNNELHRRTSESLWISWRLSSANLSLSFFPYPYVHKREIGGTYEVMYTVGRYTTLRHGSTTILSTSTPFIVRHPCLGLAWTFTCAKLLAPCQPAVRLKRFLGKY